MANDIAPTQDALYRQAVTEHADALKRLARAYEADPETRRDLLQEIHVALVRERRNRARVMVNLEEIDALPSPLPDTDRQHRLEQLFAMIRQLKPIDRQVILAYLEDLDAATIAEISGLSACNVATKIHRIKNILSRQFRAGEKS